MQHTNERKFVVFVSTIIFSSCLILLLALAPIITRAYNDPYDGSGAREVCDDDVPTVRVASAALDSAPTAASAAVEGIEGKGLVTCGVTSPCTIPDLLLTMMTVGNFLIFKVVVPLSALSIAIAGIYILLGVGSPGNIETAKKILWDVVYGVVLALGAYVIVKTIFTVLGVVGVNFK